MPNVVDCVPLVLRHIHPALLHTHGLTPKKRGFLRQKSTIIFQTILTNELSFNEAISLKFKMKCSVGHFIEHLVVRREPLGSEQTKAKGSTSQLYLRIMALNPKPT